MTTGSPTTREPPDWVQHRVEGKAKLSQNRSRADREGVVAGLRESGRPDEQGVAEQMAKATEEG